MKLITFTTALALWLLAGIYGQAQETDSASQTAVEELISLKEEIIKEEKDALKAEVENIIKRLESGNISESQAETLKQEAAEKHALNIENRLAIIDNKVALLKRNGSIENNEDRITIRITTSGKDEDNIIFIGPKSKQRKYDRRTTSDFVFAFGLNNAITEGESLQDSDFKVAGSRFAELGWAWKTRVFKNTNWLRINCRFNLMV